MIIAPNFTFSTVVQAGRRLIFLLSAGPCHLRKSNKPCPHSTDRLQYCEYLVVIFIVREIITGLFDGKRWNIFWHPQVSKLQKVETLGDGKEDMPEPPSLTYHPKE